MKDGNFLSLVKQMGNELISMSRVWDKEKKSESPTGFEPMTTQNTWRAFYPLELRRIHGEPGHILKLSFNSNIDLQNKRSEETGDN